MAVQHSTPGSRLHPTLTLNPLVYSYTVKREPAFTWRIEEPKPDDPKDGKAAKKKISFKPYHGQPYKKYFIFIKKPDGTEKYIGKMMAPNNELALAKATENFGATLGDGCSLFVRQWFDQGGQS